MMKTMDFFTIMCDTMFTDEKTPSLQNEVLERHTEKTSMFG